MKNAKIYIPLFLCYFIFLFCVVDLQFYVTMNLFLFYFFFAKTAMQGSDLFRVFGIHDFTIRREKRLEHFIYCPCHVHLLHGGFCRNSYQFYVELEIQYAIMCLQGIYASFVVLSHSYLQAMIMSNVRHVENKKFCIVMFIENKHPVSLLQPPRTNTEK